MPHNVLMEKLEHVENVNQELVHAPVAYGVYALEKFRLILIQKIVEPVESTVLLIQVSLKKLATMEAANMYVIHNTQIVLMLLDVKRTSQL